MALLFRVIPAVAGSLLALLLAGCSLPSFLITPVSNSPKLEESTVQSGSGSTKIAIIEVEGLLTNTRAGTGGLLGAEENKVSLFKQQLDAAANSKRRPTRSKQSGRMRARVFQAPCSHRR